MWKDTREARLRRYREILRGSPRLYEPAEAARRDNENKTGKLQSVLQEQVKKTESFQSDSKEPVNITEKFADALKTEESCCEAEEEEKKTFENVCDYVLAPALNGFVLWVLREAISSGKKRLYFLARDGYFMYQTAELLCRKLGLPIECRYLSCSRYSIRIPMYHLNVEEALDYICRGGIDVTMKKILNRAGLIAEEQDQILKQSGIAYEANDLIPYAKLSGIKEKLSQNQYFLACMDRHSREAMPNLEGYLIQEGLLENIPSALVDSGWVGSMQKVLGELLDEIQKKNHFPERNRLEGYYWGLYELPEHVDPKEYHCYYFSPGENLREKVYFSNCLFEGIFSAPHGMTLSYEYENGLYRPVYGEISDEHRLFMETMQQRLMDYTGHLTESFILSKKMNQLIPGKSEGLAPEYDVSWLNCTNDRETIRKLLEIFMGEPTRQEAELYGGLQFSDDVLEDGGQQIAVPMTDGELRANHAGRKILAMLGIRRTHVKESAWYEGSAVRNGHQVKRHLRRYAGYKYLLYLKKKHLWRKIYG